MTASSSMKRLWRVVLCLLLVADVPVTVYSIQISLTSAFQLRPFYLFYGKRRRLDSIRDALAKMEWRDDPFQTHAPNGGMDYEVPANLGLTLMYPCYPQDMTGSPFTHFTKVSELIPLNTDYDQRVASVLQVYEGWKNEADTLVLESLNGPDDLGFLQIIDWNIYLNQWDGRTLGAP